MLFLAAVKMSTCLSCFSFERYSLTTQCRAFLLFSANSELKNERENSGEKEKKIEKDYKILEKINRE